MQVCVVLCMNELTIIYLGIFGVLKSLRFHSNNRMEFSVFLCWDAIRRTPYEKHGLIISLVTDFQVNIIPFRIWFLHGA